MVMAEIDDSYFVELRARFEDQEAVSKGGPGSGNFHHKGRPGKKGGSGKGGGVIDSDDTWKEYYKPDYDIRNTLLERVEASISQDEIETGMIVSPAGKTLVRKKGDYHSVDFSKEKDEIGPFKGDILTHNHPNGTCFSGADMQMAFSWGLREVRVVNKSGETFRFYRDDYQPLSIQDYHDFFGARFEMLRSQQREDWSNKIVDGEMTLEYAERNHFTKVCKDATRQMNQILKRNQEKEYRYVFKQKEGDGQWKKLQ
jgi:hypothetical protein